MGCRVCRARKVSVSLFSPTYRISHHLDASSHWRLHPQLSHNVSWCRSCKAWSFRWSPCADSTHQVKCDGRPNGCRNCERLQLDCVGDSGVPGGHRSSPVALRKIRTYRSCANCRLSKTKCNGDRPKCSRCAAKNLECAYDGGTTPRWARNLNDVTTGDAGSGSHPNDASDDLGAETELGDDGGLNQEADGQSDAPMRPLSSGRPSSAEGDVSMAMAIDEPGADALSWYVRPPVWICCRD